MKLSIVIPVLNQFPLVKAVYKQLREATDTTEQEVEFIILDNGSDEPLSEMDVPGAIIFRNKKSNGVYPTFKQGMEVATGDVVAFFHSDLVIWEKGWNIRLMDYFKSVSPKFGLVGFVGSNELDSNGGRGLGTVSNFQGNTLVGDQCLDSENSVYQPRWSGSVARIHGRTDQWMTNGAVVDGCAMIILREAWDVIGFRESFPPHHFYDRLISCQMLEAGYAVGILGIACDHISGQTVNQEKNYQTMSFDWLVSYCGYEDKFDSNHNYDEDIYRLAEDTFLKEYRDTKHLLPKTI